MGKSTARIKRRRTRLFGENPHCPKCGVLMVLPETLEKRRGQIRYFPPNTCTIAHRYSKVHPQRQEYIENKNGICCVKCNVEDGHNELTALLTLDEIRERNRLGHERKNKRVGKS